ncbi:unnamed protein product, partial [Mesorhabditis belari]|uniref:Uncharacterized protein n=1 Tax=Mesorhabditis belari TaxID=2138241 RepID=A0AAF3EFP5_9BILA
MLLRSVLVALFAFVCAVISQKSESKGSPEMAMPVYGVAAPDAAETIARVENELVGALRMLGTLEEEPKIAEKRRNKFDQKLFPFG